jgi:hypothetical protein
VPRKKPSTADILAAEPRSRSDHLDVEVDVTPVGDNEFRVDFRWQPNAFLVHGDADVIQGRLVITRIEVTINPIGDPTCDPRLGEPSPPPRGITSVVWNGIPIGRLQDSIRREILAQPRFDELAELLQLPIRSAQRQLRLQAAATVQDGPLRGRPPIADDFLRKVAYIVLRAQDKGKPCRQAVERHFQISEGTAKSYMRKACQRGFLQNAGHGKRNFLPGPQLATHNPTESED